MSDIPVMPHSHLIWGVCVTFGRRRSLQLGGTCALAGLNFALAQIQLNTKNKTPNKSTWISSLQELLAKLLFDLGFHVHVFK